MLNSFCFCIVQKTNSICVCAPGNDMVLYSITRIRSNRKSQTQTQHGWIPEYNATNNCTNAHMSLSHQSVLVKVMEIPIFV